MNFWWLWPVGIIAWLVLGWTEFGVIEARALKDKNGDNDGHPTLSFWVYTIFTKFPLSIMIVGLAIGFFAGILSTHFLWHWCPPGSVSAG